MQKIFIKLLKKLRRQYIRKHGEPQHCSLCKETDPNIISRQIREKLLSPEPCMLSRFGSVEIGCLTNYLGIFHQKRKIIKYIKGEAFPWWWDKETIYTMKNNAGFFSPTPDLLKQFSETMIKDMPAIDILASWRYEEAYFSNELQKAYKIDFEPYNPFWSDIPWTVALENRKVLVVHPFAESIQKQYLRKELIHKDQRVLPNFNLQTIKAVQTIGNHIDSRFKTWFDEGRNDIVVLFAVLVVEGDVLLEAVGDVPVGDRHLAVGGPDDDFEDVEQLARVAAREAEQRAGFRDLDVALFQLGVGRQGAVEQRLQVLVFERLEDVDLTAAQERRDHLERGVFGRRADEREDALLDGP